MTPLPDDYTDHDHAVPPPKETKPGARWDTAGVRSVYANVCNVTGTREEVVLDFGVHHRWDLGAEDPAIQLTSRVVLNPHACKRLALMLEAFAKEYEARYGSLDTAGDDSAR